MAERFAKLTGTWADTGSVGPSTATRASSGYLTKYDDSSAHELYLVGDNWMRTGRYNDGSESRWNVQVEDSAENLCLYSEDFSTTWTALDAGDTFGTGVATPDPTKTSDALIADATDGDHGYSQSITLTAAEYAISVYAKAGNKNWLYISDDTVANATGYFDLATPATGTKGAGANALYVEDIGGGWVRCIMTVTGTAAAHTIKIQTADADTDKTVTGDASTINTHLFGAQVELGAYPSTYIPTTSAAVTRGADAFLYDGQSFGAVQTIAGSIYAPVNLANLVLLNLSDGGASTDDVELTLLDAGDALQMVHTLASNAITSTATTDIADGTWHDYSAIFGGTTQYLYIDAASEDSDAGQANPSGLDRLTFGSASHGPIELYASEKTP